MLDACTSDMCLNPWGRKSFARILIELNSENAVMESIVVAIPLPKGKGYYLEALNVEYEWWPPRCSKCKIFVHEDDFCPVRDKKTKVGSSSGANGVRDNVGKQVRNGVNKAAKGKQGFRFLKPKNNFMYRPVVTTKEGTSKLKANSSKEGSVGDANEPLESTKVSMNDSSDSDESKVEEVSMPYGKPGGGFLDDLEDDLDCYDGYEAQLYELTEQQRAIYDWFDIRLNSQCRKHGYAVSSLMDTAYWSSE
ncbi:hypothetical protein Tco_1035011 [Tanacetum coccineum]